MVCKNKDSVVLSCSCGCGGTYIFKYAFDILYVECLDGVFSTKQPSIIYDVKEKVKKLHKKIKNKPVYLQEVVMDKKEFWEFIDALTELVESMSDEENENTIGVEEDTEASSIVAERYRYPDTDFEEDYDICLKSKLSTKHLLFNEYRAYDTCFTKKQMMAFLKNVNKKFER